MSKGLYFLKKKLGTKPFSNLRRASSYLPFGLEPSSWAGDRWSIRRPLCRPSPPPPPLSCRRLHHTTTSLRASRQAPVDPIAPPPRPRTHPRSALPPGHCLAWNVDPFRARVVFLPLLVRNPSLAGRAFFPFPRISSSAATTSNSSHACSPIWSIWLRVYSRAWLDY